jgi:isorenieratene synthase
MGNLWNIGRPLPPIDPARLPGKGRPDWVQADERFINEALGRARARENGGWVVLDASRKITGQPRKFVVDGREWVAWRVGDEVRTAPNDCPHMGAPMCEGRVQNGDLVCPWHGLKLGKRAHGSWVPVPAFDDGVLVWARILTNETPTERPFLTPRPDRFLDGVVSMPAVCEPEDVVANRLDPWHGTHFHPHSFATLTVTGVVDDALLVRVAYRVVANVVVEVDCQFHAPTRRSIVMTITDGDGKGSVVETHATPIGPGRSTMIEATLAWSDRIGFPWMFAVRDWVRPMIERRAERLWIEDVAYAERRYAVRTRQLAMQPTPA